MTLPTRLDAGVMLDRFGPVHRDAGNGRTICGQLSRHSEPVTDYQVRLNNLSRCHRCYPDWSVARIPAGIDGYAIGGRR